MNYSVRNIVIAGGLAVVAIIAVLLYTSNVRDKARQDQHRVQVLVAAKDIPAGTTGKQVIDGHLLVPKAIIQTDQVPGALTSMQGLDNLVVSQTIYHAQQVPSAVFQPPLSTGTSLQIRATERAISVPVDQDSGLIGTLQNGDHVDVLLAYKGENGGPSFTRPLLRDVLVLTAPDAKAADGHVLLKLSDVDSTKLLYAEQFQKVWLVERPKTQAQDSPAALETASTVLFDGLTPGQISKAVAGLTAFTKSLNAAASLGGGA
ncbi:MAG: pilus assembly protein CpaB [Gaiellales bacterium]|jgi:pilus assembly protein CpaB|nr:pilus assembly protein CpaB [Gaiellales bacterium]